MVTSSVHQCAEKAVNDVITKLCGKLSQGEQQNQTGTETNAAHQQFDTQLVQKQ